MKKINKLIAIMLALACMVTTSITSMDVNAATTFDGTYSGNFGDYKYEEARDYYISYVSGTWTYEISFSTDIIIAFYTDKTTYAPNINYIFGYLGSSNSTYWNYLKNSISCEVRSYNGVSDSTATSNLNTQFIVSSMDTNVPIFETQEEAKTYILNGGDPVELKKYANPNSVGVQICYDVYDTFEITVPKKVELSKGNAETIPMNVKGDLAGLSTLDITPEATMTLTQSPKDPVTVNLSMVKGSFSFAELLGDGQITGITIDASGLSAGEWTGSCIVNVNITDHTGE